MCVVDDAHWLDPGHGGCPALLRPPDSARTGWSWSSRPATAPGGTFRPAGAPRDGPDRPRSGRGPRPARRAPGGHAPARRSPTGWSPRRAATRWRCWSCRPSSHRASSRGSTALPAQLHLTDRVEQVFLDRSRRLPPAVQRCCCSPRRTTPEIAACCAVRRAALGLARQRSEAATDSGLLVADAASVAVRHPLVRSAIYQAATDEQTAPRAPGAGRGPGRRRGPRP